MEPEPVTTRERLDNLHCQHPNCDHSAHDSKLFVHAKCHPGKGLEVMYEAGVLTIRCLVCKTFIVAVGVE